MAPSTEGEKTKTTTVILVHRYPVHIIIIIIIIRVICKASTLRLKAPNKHSVTHTMYIKMDNAMSNFTKILRQCRHQKGVKHNYVK